jgi:hypothetical protein
VYIAGGRVGQKNLVALLEDLFQNAEDLDSNWWSRGRRSWNCFSTRLLRNTENLEEEGSSTMTDVGRSRIWGETDRSLDWLQMYLPNIGSLRKDMGCVTDGRGQLEKWSWWLVGFMWTELWKLILSIPRKKDVGWGDGPDKWIR